MKLVIFSDDERARHPIAVSAKKHGFDLHVASGVYRWYKDLETRTQKTLEILQTFDPKEIVVVTDGHDVFVNNSAEVFLKEYHEHYSGKVVFQSEHTNWPDPRLEQACLDKHTDPHGYSFLCFGMHAGPAGALVDIYKRGLEIGFVERDMRNLNPHCSWGFDDQLFAIKQYIENPNIVIDSDCRLCQSMQLQALQSGDIAMTDQFILNTTKNTQPVFIHGHGNVAIKATYEEIVKKYGYNP